MRVLLTDCETTGLSAKDEPIEVGMLLVSQQDGSTEYIIEDRYSGRQEPSVPIHPRAQAIHGISPAELRGQSFDRAKIGELVNRADVIVAHNANFDARMLAKVDPQFLRKPWRCSLRQSPWPAETGGKSLDSICSHFQVIRDKAHSAPSDAMALLDCLNRHTGKTARSRRYLDALLAKPAYILSTEARPGHGPQRDREPLSIVISLDTGTGSGGRDEGGQRTGHAPRSGGSVGKVLLLLGVVGLLGYCTLS